MKTLLTVLLSLIILPLAIHGETLQVDITKLTAEQLKTYQQLKQMQAQQETAVESLSPERIDRYAQIGKAFGSAFKECWTTVSTDAEKFANSSAGKWAMILVSWKIMGNDATQLTNQFIHYITGGLLLSVGTLFFIYVFRRNCVSLPRVKSKVTFGPITLKKEYDGMTDPIHSDETPGYYVTYVIFVIICAMIMFL